MSADDSLDFLIEDLLHAAVGHGNDLRFLRKYFRRKLETSSAALLAVEWTDRDGSPACAGCVGPDDDDIDDRAHMTGCVVDKALTAAGFPDRASRDAARARMAAK